MPKDDPRRDKDRAYRAAAIYPEHSSDRPSTSQVVPTHLHDAAYRSHDPNPVDLKYHHERYWTKF
jgi:hypothetical protein